MDFTEWDDKENKKYNLELDPRSTQTVTEAVTSSDAMVYYVWPDFILDLLNRPTEWAIWRKRVERGSDVKKIRGEVIGNSDGYSANNSQSTTRQGMRGKSSQESVDGEKEMEKEKGKDFDKFPTITTITRRKQYFEALKEDRLKEVAGRAAEEVLVLKSDLKK